MYRITLDITEDLAGFRVSFHAWADGRPTPKTLTADVWTCDVDLDQRDSVGALMYRAVQDVTHTAAENLLRVAADQSTLHL